MLVVERCATAGPVSDVAPPALPVEAGWLGADFLAPWKEYIEPLDSGKGAIQKSLASFDIGVGADHRCSLIPWRMTG